MEAVSTSETSVYIYETTRRSILEDCHLHTRRDENLKSLFNLFVVQDVMRLCEQTEQRLEALTAMNMSTVDF
jgi:hypothetical protein